MPINFGGLFLLILSLLIHYHYVHPMEQQNTKSSAGTSTYAKITNQQKETGFPQSLEWMFALVKWLAKYWANLSKEPNVVEELQKAIENLKRKNIAAKILEPNGKEKTFWAILEKVLQEVNNTESEIMEGLNSETHEGEDQNGRRLRHKHEFQFAFMIDCIYAAHFNENGEIGFGDIATKLKGPSVQIYPRNGRNDVLHTYYGGRYEEGHSRQALNNVEEHPFYGILTENECGNKDAISSFLSVLLRKFFKFNRFYHRSMEMGIEQFFHGVVLEEFLTAMKGKETEKPAPSNLYFTERLSKLHTLGCLISTLQHIIESVMKPKSDIPTDFMLSKNLHELFPKAIDNLTDIKAFMYFTITNGTQYKEALMKLPTQMKAKMNKITYKSSFFAQLLAENKSLYSDWSSRKYVRMARYLAINSFGFNKIEFDPIPSSLFDHGSRPQFVEKIAYKIVDEYRASKNSIGKSAIHSRQELSDHIKLNLFCLGLQGMMTNQPKYKNQAEFYEDFNSYEMHPNASRNSWVTGLQQLLPTKADIQKVRQILPTESMVLKTEMVAESEVTKWVQNKTEKMFEQFCVPQK